MQLSPLLAALLSILVMASCGPRGPDPRSLMTSGNEALARGDYESAAKSFEEALVAIGWAVVDPLHMELQKGFLRAEAGCAPDEAVKDLGILANNEAWDVQSELDEAFYGEVAVELSRAGNFDQAVAVVQAATARFGKTQPLDDQVAGIRKAMKSAGASKALKALDDLGYTGNG